MRAEAAAGPREEGRATRGACTPRTGVGSGYRYYSPELGRWVNRDPIGERGGLALYSFTANRPLCRHDYLGLLAPPRFLPALPSCNRETVGAVWSGVRTVFRRNEDLWVEGVENPNIKSRDTVFTLLGLVAGAAGPLVDVVDKAPQLTSLRAAHHRWQREIFQVFRSRAICVCIRQPIRSIYIWRGHGREFAGTSRLIYVWREVSLESMGEFPTPWRFTGNVRIGDDDVF